MNYKALEKLFKEWEQDNKDMADLDIISATIGMLGSDLDGAVSTLEDDEYYGEAEFIGDNWDEILKEVVAEKTL